MRNEAGFVFERKANTRTVKLTMKKKVKKIKKAVEKLLTDYSEN